MEKREWIRSWLELVVNNPNDPNQAQFKAFLNRLADAEVTRADYDWVRRLCSRHSMTAQEWDRRGFNDPNITHLYPTNNEVNLHNTQALNSLDKPILRIEAKNSNAMMRKLRPDRCGGLTNVLFLSNDSRVTLTYNLCPEIGLANGSTGKVIDVKYREGESPQNKDLPYCVWVEMDGYSGPSFFPEVLRRNKWVPIYQKTHVEYFKPRSTDDWTPQTRVMIPLRLSWAWTIHKARHRV